MLSRRWACALLTAPAVSLLAAREQPPRAAIVEIRSYSLKPASDARPVLRRSCLGIR